MDVDLESVEIVFAQRLASGEPTTRARALKALHEWIHQQSQERPFGEADMMRLCKGLHYVLWMQDKMLLQEELADRISGLLTVFTHEDERVEFIRSLFASLSKEWHAIDRWRMDKFLMLMRRVLRVLFYHLKSMNWKKEVRSRYWNAFSKTTISDDPSFSQGLKFHFAAIFLDELDNAGGLSEKQVTICLKPFADLITKRKISDYLFNSILDEIFATILHSKSEELAREEGDEAEDLPKPGITFDYKAIGKMLFDIGKKSEIISGRRRKLYDLVKKFEVAAAGRDPYHFEVPKPSIKLTNSMYEQAEKDLIELTEAGRKETIEYKRSKKRSAEEVSFTSQDNDETPVKKKKKMVKGGSSNSEKKTKKVKKNLNLAKKKRPIKAKKVKILK